MAGEYYCGIDVGSASTKTVIVGADDNEVVGHSVVRSGMDFEEAARKSFKDALAEAGVERCSVVGIVSTGYGRRNVPFAQHRKTEITCHARGCHFYFPRRITVVDIGGQDNKIIHITETGGRDSFKMNRKCAAGTGAFLEEIAGRLGLPVSELEELARQSTREITLGSFCTVFTQTEILAKIRQGVKVPDIIKGAFNSVITRILEMDPLDGEVVLTGGVVAHNPIIAEMFSKRLGKEILVPPMPQCTGALGAALSAKEMDS